MLQDYVTPGDLAMKLQVSRDKILQIFKGAPGVIDVGGSSRRMIRIPKAITQETIEKWVAALAAERNAPERFGSVERFLAACCELPVQGQAEDEIKECFFVRAGELGALYELWWYRNNAAGADAGSLYLRALLGECMESLGFKRSRSRRDENKHQFRSFEGLRLRDELPPEVGVRGTSGRARAVRNVH